MRSLTALGLGALGSLIAVGAVVGGLAHQGKVAWVEEVTHVVPVGNPSWSQYYQCDITSVRRFGDEHIFVRGNRLRTRDASMTYDIALYLANRDGGGHGHPARIGSTSRDGSLEACKEGADAMHLTTLSTN